MSVLNPQEYVDTYRGLLRDSYNDRQADIGRDVTLMNAQYEFDDAWYNAHESVPAKIDEMVASGINPIHAARAAMGSLSADSGSQPTASTNGYNSAEALINGVNAFNSAASNVNQAVQTDLAMQRQDAEINKMQSEAALNFANAGEVAGLSASTQARNYASAGKDEASVDEIRQNTKVLAEVYNLTHEEARLAQQQADSFSELRKSELETLKAKNAEYWSQVGVNKATQENVEHQTDLVDAEKILTEAKTDTEQKTREKVVSETTGQNLENQGKRQVIEYQSLIGRPLNTNTIDALNGYVEKGDYQGASNLMHAVFDVAERSAAGSNHGGAYMNLGVMKAPLDAGSTRTKVYYNRSHKNPYE